MCSRRASRSNLNLAVVAGGEMYFFFFKNLIRVNEFIGESVGAFHLCLKNFLLPSF